MPRRSNRAQSNHQSWSSIIISKILYFVFLCVHIIIVIGESTRFLFTIPFKGLQQLKNGTHLFSRKALPFVTITKSSQAQAHISKQTARKTEKTRGRSFFISLKTSVQQLFSRKPVADRRQAETERKRKYVKRGRMGKLIFRIFKYLRKLLKRFFRYLGVLLRRFFKRVRKIILSILAFIWFIIKLPFQFVISLLTVPVRFFILGFIICSLIFIGLYANQFVKNLPSPHEIGKINYSLSTHIFDRNGKLLYEIYQDQNRTPVKLNKIPKYVYQASIAIEDKDFYSHKGVSLFSGILRAARETVFKGNLQGGSTITQQLVKSALLTSERTIQRKVKEIILALWTEQIYTKDQILEMYMNQVAYGGSSYGIESAAKTYFGKDAKDLTIAEAALLAGLPQAPSEYSPFVNPALARQRRDEVLKKLKEQNYISDAQFKNALATPVHTISPETTIKAPHFVFYVKNELEKQYGIRTVEQGGLNVTTTLDLGIQEDVQKILNEELDKLKGLNVTNGGILITKPSTGEILAMVGSADYFREPDGAFNVTTAERQPGSSIKPLLYSLALEKGYTAATVIPDVPTTFQSGVVPYRPVNYDGAFHGATTFRVALSNSFNIPAVRVVANLGTDTFAEHAKKLGITTWNDPSRWVLPMALGGLEVRMVDMATAYSALANEGYRVDVTGVLKLQDVGEQTIYTLVPQKTKVLDDGVAYIMSDVMSDNVSRQIEFGPHSLLEIPGYRAAVKTGTTDSKKDNWTIGYTPEYMVAVWVGNNDNSPMNPALTSGITGAAPIWHRVMQYLLDRDGKKPNDWYTKPENIVEKYCAGRVEYFIRGTENSVSCSAPPLYTPTPQKQQARPQADNQQPTPTQAQVIAQDPVTHDYKRGRGNNKR